MCSRIGIHATVFITLICWLGLLAGLLSPACADEPPKKDGQVSSDVIRAAVAKSLPLLETGAKGSMEERKQCFTCHNQGLPILALTTARTRGFKIDEEHLRTQIQFTSDFLNKNKDKYLKGEGQGGQIDTAGAALWALDNGGRKPDAVTSAVAEYLLTFQKEEDHYRPQSKRPPSEQSHFTSSYVALRGLKVFGTPEQKDRIAARIEQVRKWLIATQPTDTEDSVFRLQALHLADAPLEEINRAKELLRKAQREDGGWSQLPDLKSDAYATGSVLVALQQTGGLTTYSEEYQQGLKFLLSIQKEDGSWHVASRSVPFQTYFESGYPHGADQFISIAAAGWATTALALALPDQNAPSSSKTPADKAEPGLTTELIFPLHAQHNHAPGIVECPNGDLFATWYRGSGERTADDVAVYAAWRGKGDAEWSAPFLLADTPGFPDCNTALFVDDKQRLWLFYPTIIANSWESCLQNFKVSSHFMKPGAPKWDREGLILLKPDDFGERGRQELDARLGLLKLALNEKQKQGIEKIRERLGDKLFQRLGWQPRCKPTQLPNGRILLPLYTDTFSISIMAISDDHGETWHASQPLLGFGAIQPTVLRRNDGTLVAYMRENGYTNKVRVSESSDNGDSWGEVGVTDLPNPGSGLDGLRLKSGHWALVYNDTPKGRNRLAVSLSADEGRTWTKTRYLEDQPQGSYHYPAMTQGADGTIHVVYSYFVEGGKSMKHAAFDEAWIGASAGK